VSLRLFLSEVPSGDPSGAPFGALPELLSLILYLLLSLAVSLPTMRSSAVLLCVAWELTQPTICSMLDHSVFSIMATVQTSASTSSMSMSSSSLESAEQQFLQLGTGPYSAPSGITNMFQQLSNATLTSIGAQAVISAGLTNQSTVEILYDSIFYPTGPAILPSTNASDANNTDSAPNLYYTINQKANYISLTASPLVPLSRGSITLKSNSMADAPNIDPNYYSDPTGTDRVIAINAFRDLRRLLAHPALSQFTIGPDNGEVQPGLIHVPTNASDDVIFEYIKANTIPNWHASGTNRMLPEEGGGVVDSRLRVYGVEGLRVADVSVFPTLPDVNLVGVVYMLAERAAAIFKEDFGGLSC
jgi:choline dehydrogenase